MTLDISSTLDCDSLLGYGNKTVDRAVQKQILEIDTGTGPSVRMVELAETLVKLKRSGNVWLFYYSFNTDTKISIKS